MLVYNRQTDALEEDNGAMLQESAWFDGLSAKVRKIVENGKLPAYAWPGGYPLFYLDTDNNTLCPACANKHDMSSGIVDYDANWEDPSLYCDDCGKRIESAYAEDDPAGDPA